MSNNGVLKIRLSLKGRPLRTYTFNQDLISVGRDPACDIVLDNVSVSREHLKFEMSPSGYYSVEDLASANGSFLNDAPLKKDYVYNNDVIRIGKYSLWIAFETDRRDQPAQEAGRVSPDAFQGTMVLSTRDIDRMMATARETDRRPPVELAPPAEARPTPGAMEIGLRRSRHVVALGIVLAFLLGTVVGAGATWFLTQ